MLDAHTGLAMELVVRVRADVASDIARPTDPMGSLLPVRGQRVLVPPVWAAKAGRPKAGIFSPRHGRLLLTATPAQIGHSPVLRDDAALTADVWAILTANPALQPVLGGVRVAVRDGTVMLRGHMPSIRLRLAAEQDIWHVPGVFAIQDELALG
jgi:hypothetical protein